MFERKFKSIILKIIGHFVEDFDDNEIFVDPELGARAMVPLRRMLEFAAQLNVTVRGNA